MLRYQKATKTFGNGRGIRDVDFSVDRDEIVGFVGRNGAGKTTSMRVAMSLLELDDGVVTWSDAAITPETVRRFGYMPEERGLYPRMRVDEQLRYFAELRGLRGNVAAERVRTWSERLRFADKLSDRLQTLSLGNQQRVQLAAAFLGDPELLVLDEPFSGLDPVAVTGLADVLREFRRAGAAIVVSSHQLGVLEQLCDRVVVISEGTIVADAPLTSLLAGAPDEFRISFRAGTPPWRHPLIRHEESGVYTVRVDDASQLGEVLAAANAHGELQEVTRRLRSLADVLHSSEVRA
ncbi:ABC transporter ATP-binding protein [Microbacterium hibisci]|uniref:ABC transporter ATP-binding protein n=1 Tax=Microbacterium hibisci TaxID=2036000 RepID=UPI001942B755|nr:ATP-binding cassette domain-containing protein [Microbacterium hibisci]